MSIKQFIKKNKSSLVLLFVILSFVGGVIPNAIDYFASISNNPVINIDIRHTNINDACEIIIFNYGNENAKEIEITIEVINEYSEIIANNSINLPILSKPLENGNIVWKEIPVRFDKLIDGGDYIVRVIIEGQNFETVEKEETIEIF